MTALPESYEPSLHRELIESLTRQAAAMERLADLLPQLVAVNQALLEALADREDDEPASTYLDGSPIGA